VAQKTTPVEPPDETVLCEKDEENCHFRPIVLGTILNMGGKPGSFKAPRRRARKNP
jgi:hypothetical protein